MLSRLFRALGVLLARRILALGPALRGAGKRWLRRFAWAFAGFAVLFVWVNACDSPRPPARTLLVDLPPLPAAEGNGWAIIAAEAAPLLRNVRDGLPESPETMRVQAATDDVLEGRRELAEAAGDLAAALPAQERAFRDSCRRAFAEPRFADASGPDVEFAYTVIVRCHRAVTADVLAALNRRGPDEAIALTADLLRSHRDHVTSARSSISQAVALYDATTALRLAILVIAARPEARPVLEGGMRAYPELQGLPGVTGAYVYLSALIARTERGELGLWRRLLLDPGETQQRLDAYFDGISVAPPALDTGWWFDNASGDLLLKQSLVGFVGLWGKRDRYEEAREAAHAALTRL